jgi:hypothetical protein
MGCGRSSGCRASTGALPLRGLGLLEEVSGHVVAEVVFAAVLADVGGDFFEDEDAAFSVEDDEGGAELGLSVFTDDALHRVI